MATTKSNRKSTIDAGAAFGDLLAKEFPSKAERADFATDVQAELATIQALAQLEKKRKAAGVAKATIARRLGTHAPVVSRMFNSGDANPTLRTFAKTLSAMGMQAEIRYRKVRSGAPPLRVVGR